MNVLKKILCILTLFFASLFISVGYAELSSEFKISGIVAADIPKTLFISSVKVTVNNNVTVQNQAYTSTVLSTTTSYSGSGANIEFEVTFYNGSDLIYEYIGTEYNTHSNNNVSRTVSNITEKQTVEGKSYVTIKLKFTSNINNATLNSIINFKFAVKNTSENVGVANHEALSDAMINDPTNGLNNSDSYLNEQIASRNKGSLIIPSRDTLGSMAISQGNSLESMFGDSYAYNEQISFLLQFIDTNGDDVIDYYYLFTTSLNLGANGSPNFAIGEYIYPVYRTKIVYDTKEAAWVSEEIVEGYAKSAYYEESQPNFLINRSKIPSFDPDSWVVGRLGTSFSNAALMTVNQGTLICIEALSDNELRYYKVTIPSNSRYTFVVEGDNETKASDVLIQIYNSNQTLVSSAYGSLNFPVVNSNTTYYVVLSGATTIDYKFNKN